MELDTTAKVRNAFYRLCGTESDDTELTLQGEGDTEVVDLYLTDGCRNAQQWMLDMGYGGWRKRSSVLSWTGTDAANGGRDSTLPTDFLRAYGDERESCLHEANGNTWGAQISPERDRLKGNLFYFRGDELWLARLASPPTTLYLEYHYTHPGWDGLADGDIDFPKRARRLIVAEAANVAKEENWLPGGPEMEMKIERALRRARSEARGYSRQTKQPRQFRKVRRVGNRW